MNNQITRRWFIGGMAASAAALGRAAARLESNSIPRLKIGVLSDIHLEVPGDESTFLKALSYFRDNEVDGVVIAGDIAQTGRIGQLKQCADSWYKIFPNGKLPNGRTVEQLFVLGNHDIDGWKYPKMKKLYSENPGLSEKDGIGVGDNRFRFWEECFHEPFAPIWKKTIKGYTFIGSHWNRANGGIPIEAFMKKHGGDINPSLPFFYIQHEHPKDTCIGSWAWGHDNGRSTRALSPFSNAIAFSGHSHYTLTDERSVWQGAFTSINAGSLKYTGYDYALRENMPRNTYGYRGETRKRIMGKVDTRNGRQGMLMSVFDDRIVLERREFVTDKSLGDDWVIPLPCAKEKPYVFSNHIKRRIAPEFAAGAVATAKMEHNPKTGNYIAVRFPHAQTRGKCRPFEYEVTATLLADDVDLVQAQRRVMSPDYHLPLGSKTRLPICLFLAADLPLKGRYRFDVRPIECFGRKGRAISTELTI